MPELTPEQKALQDQLTTLKSELDSSLETKMAAHLKAAKEAQIKEIEEKLAAARKPLEEKAEKRVSDLETEVKDLKAAKVTADERDRANQVVIDQFIADKKKREAGTEKKSFGEAMHEELANQFESKQAEIKEFGKSRDAKLNFTLKVGTMTIPTNLSGQGQATFNDRQGIVPNQRVNIRDLIPSTISPTGIYVTYRETATSGGINTQVEGASKGQIDYTLSRVETVSGYVSGFARFSKQMMFVLPWLQSTLVRMLLRDFYKEENRKFYAAIALAASGFNTTAETDDNKAIIDLLYGRADQDFNNSFILGKNNMVGRMLKLMYGNGYYSGAGSVVGTPNGAVTISGIPVIGASFATSDKVMIIDTDFIERVETESLRVEFSYEDADNFTKNLVTARVECFEDLNLLRTDAHSFLDLGNS